MSRKLAVLLLSIVSGTSLAQMMGGPISTTQYSPLVDGARYDYVYTSGPWATSTAVMHSGQTWAGVSGLTAMHTTYVCNVGLAMVTGELTTFSYWLLARFPLLGRIG